MATADLSFGERRFRQTYTARFALAVLTFATMYALWFFLGEPDFQVDSPFLWACVSAGAINLAIFVALGKTVLAISDNGLRQETIFGEKEFRWDDIQTTQYRVRLVRSRAPMGLLGMTVAAARRPRRIKLRLAVISHDGTKITINDSYRRAREAIGIVLGRIVPRMAASVRQRLSRGETVMFGPLALSSTTLAWKRRPPVPISAISRAEIVGANLKISCTGRWLSLIRVRSDKIPDVLVLLDVLETIAPQLRPSRMDPLARVQL